MKQWIIKFFRNPLKDGVYDGDLGGLLKALGVVYGKEAELRVVKSRRLEGHLLIPVQSLWVEVWEHVDSKILGSTYQRVGGFRCTRKWVAVEGGGFIEEIMPDEVVSYD